MKNKTILEQIYYREIKPMEEVAGTSKEYVELQEEVRGKRAKFVDALNQSPKFTKFFNEMEELQALCDDMYSYDCFAYGFKLGASLLSEISIDFQTNIMRD